MSETDEGQLPTHTDSVRIEAPPARVWELVTAMERYGEWSSENTGGYWRKGADGVPGTGQVGDQFVGVNRRALEVFSRSFPLEYPEIEALVVLQRKRFRFVEVPCKMRPRTTGRSSLTAFKSLRYIFHVLLGVFINVLRYERRFHREGGGRPGGTAGG